MSEQKYKKHLDSFLLCLNQKKYYEAHEALEEVWFPRRFEDNDEIKLLKGFINASVSFELDAKGRKEASQKVWKNYLKYKPLLFKIKSPYIDTYNLISNAIEQIKD